MMNGDTYIDQRKVAGKAFSGIDVYVWSSEAARYIYVSFFDKLI